MTSLKHLLLTELHSIGMSEEEAERFADQLIGDNQLPVINQGPAIIASEQGAVTPGQGE